MSNSERSIDIQWNSRIEQYFAQTGEKANCLSWIHQQCEHLYSQRTIWIDLPVIILGTLNGAISVGSNSLFQDAQFASVGVGVVALLTAIMTTVGSYFAWAKRSEAHRISALSYAKLYRFLNVEMSLPRHERMMPSDLLKYVKTEYDRLSEISPIIPGIIIERFQTKFSGEKYTNVSKPEITNGLHSIDIYNEFHVNTSFLNQNLRLTDGNSIKKNEVATGVMVPIANNTVLPR